jgi:hypothetical protein
MSSFTSELSPNEPHKDPSEASCDELRRDTSGAEGSPCSSLRIEIDSEQSAEFSELERHGLLSELSRRRFIQASSALAASFAFGVPSLVEGQEPTHTGSVTLKVNRKSQLLSFDPRTSLLDALREHMDMTGTKKGCDHGQCGAYTVLIEVAG